MSDEAVSRNVRLKQAGVRLVLYPLLVYVDLLVIVMFLENALIYHPSRYPEGDWSLSRDGFKPIDCLFKTEDGVEIHAWYIKADKPVGTLLYFHGNAGNLSHRAPILEQLVAHDLSVLIIDYRGFGRSQDVKPSEDGLYQDGRAAWRYLTETEKVPPERIVLMGNSLGGTVACQLAGEVKCAGLIMQSSFTSIGDMSKEVIPLLPLGWALRHKMRNLEKLRTITLPKLLIHGKRDEIIPFSHGERLMAAAAEPKEFYPIAHAGHNDLWMVGGVAYHQKLRAFVASVTR